MGFLHLPAPSPFIISGFLKPKRFTDFNLFSGSLYISSILGGFFVSGTIPLFLELTVETTYPVAEGVTTGLLTLINNTFTVLFLLVLAIPGVGRT